jgi:polysaccharide biosynthesis protein PslH
MNVLMVLLHVPAPTIGVSTRNYHLLRALAREHSVSLIVLADEQTATNRADAARLAGLVRSVRLIAPPVASKRLKQLLHLVQRQSHRVMAATFPAVQEALDELFSREWFDVVLFESTLPAGYQLPSGVRVIVDQHNIEYELLRRTARDEPVGPRKFYNWLESRRLEPIELQRCAAADAVLVTSERERQVLLHRLPHSLIGVVPNGVDLDFFSRAAAPQTSPVAQPEASETPQIIFTGAMNYFPNVDAVVAFGESCWPRIREQVPNATWAIMGKDPLPAVQRLAELHGVTVVGSVSDVRPYLARATVAIAPLLVGGGTRLKILEAFAMGLPVVATSLGCEGLAFVPGGHLLVADTPEDLAEAIVRCLRDPQLRARLAAAGRALAVAEYSWDRSGARLSQLVWAMAEERDDVERADRSIRGRVAARMNHE